MAMDREPAPTLDEGDDADLGEGKGSKILAFYSLTAVSQQAPEACSARAKTRPHSHRRPCFSLTLHFGAGLGQLVLLFCWNVGISPHPRPDAVHAEGGIPNRMSQHRRQRGHGLSPIPSPSEPPPPAFLIPHPSPHFWHTCPPECAPVRMISS